MVDMTKAQMNGCEPIEIPTVAIKAVPMICLAPSKGCIRMPRGSKSEKRPADANARAAIISKIATGELQDMTTDDGRNAAAVALGRMGGNARAEALGKRKRAEIAKNAAAARWKSR